MNNIIEVRNLTFKYQKTDENHQLNDISFHVKHGEWLSIIGHNGSGKSTVVRLIDGLLEPESGQIYISGDLLTPENVWDKRSEIGMVFQNPDNQIVTDKVWHELAFGLESLGYSNADIRIRVAEMASYFGIQDWFYKNVSELSGGQKQLLNLASIMAMHPDMLILDEPTSSLNESDSKALLDLMLEFKNRE